MGGAVSRADGSRSLPLPPHSPRGARPSAAGAKAEHKSSTSGRTGDGSEVGCRVCTYPQEGPRRHCYVPRSVICAFLTTLSFSYGRAVLVGSPALVVLRGGPTVKSARPWNHSVSSTEHHGILLSGCARGVTSARHGGVLVFLEV